MKKVRLSFTFLDLWRQGKYEEAIDAYLHIQTHVNEAIKRGVDFDKYVKTTVEKTNQFPKELGEIKLVSPTTSVKIVTDYDERFSLSAELDVYDKPMIYEVKNSVAKTSGEFMDGYQIPIYFLISDLAGLSVDRAMIFRYDPIVKKYDSSLVWKNSRMIEKARRLIEENKDDIYKFLSEKGIV